MSLRPPHEMNSREEFLQANNLDLPDLSPSELEEQIFRAQRIAAHDPDAFVWRYMTHISARQWADERIGMARKLLAKPAELEQRKRRMSKAWA
ncbi:MAG: hypothetical protein JW990_09165 [Thermoleophilia bacterium]|nr:hypothetical protein [Thermoleophilia bacterium]